MSKTIVITTDSSQFPAVEIDAAQFAKYVRVDLAKNPCAAMPISRYYMTAGLIVIENEVMVVTPRGEDLLASAHLIPDDPEPESVIGQSCSACNGTGEQVLFVSMHVCDHCKGSKVEPLNRIATVLNDRITITCDTANALLGFNPIMPPLIESGRVGSSRPGTSLRRDHSVGYYSCVLDGVEVRYTRAQLTGGKDIDYGNARLVAPNFNCRAIDDVTIEVRAWANIVGPASVLYVSQTWTEST